MKRSMKHLFILTILISATLPFLNCYDLTRSNIFDPESGSYIQPEINIMQGGDDLSLNATYDFGPSLINADSAKDFQIINLGDDLLQLIGDPYNIEITGPDADCFTLSDQPDMSIPAGTQSIFTITFRPVSVKKHTAKIVVNNSDNDEGAYSIFLMGRGMIKLEDDTLESGSRYGYSVDISGDYAIVGVPYDNLGEDKRGSAYIYHWNGTTWTQQAKLTASNGEDNDYFGSSVAIYGEWAVVGAYLEGEIILEDEKDYGAVYVYKRNGSTWDEDQILYADTRVDGDNFGKSVDIYGDRIIAGAPGVDNGLKNNTGAAYVFFYDGSDWTQEAKLEEDEGDMRTGDNLGESVYINDEYAVAGMPTTSSLHGAAYVFKRSGISWSEQQKLEPSDPNDEDKFGCSVSMSGNYIIVGAKQNDTLGHWSGSAYIFSYNGSTWTQAKKLTAGDGASNHNFGKSVSISGNYAVVGSYGGTIYTGKTYMYRFNGADWIEHDTNTHPDAVAGEYFGSALAVSDNYLIAGSWGDGTGTAHIFPVNLHDQGLAVTGLEEYDFYGWEVAVSEDYAIVGVEGDDSNTGSAWMYSWNGYMWCESLKLTADDGDAGDSFGNDVAIDGSYAVVGAFKDNDNGTDSGSAYVFVRNTSGWVQQQKLVPDDAGLGMYFGASVAIDGDTIMIGASTDDEKAPDAGAVYVFKRNGSTWTQVQKLMADDGYNGDRFGYGLCVDGNYAVIGANRRDEIGAPPDGNSGAAYIFFYNGMSWVQQQKLLPDDGADEDRFGYAVSLSGDTAVVGAFMNDGADTDAGKVYVYTRSGTVWTQAQKLTAYDAAAYDQLGISVAVNGNYLVAGAVGDDDKESDAGSAFLFHYNGSEWVQFQKITPVTGMEQGKFGNSVYLSDSFLIIGEYCNDTSRGAANIRRLE